MLNNYICTLDIGSSKIAACVAQIKRGRIENIFFESQASRGVKEGIIVNSIDLVGSITSVMKALKAKSGINIKYIYTNITGKDIITKHSRAIIPLAERGNKVITTKDIQKANEQARILGSSLEGEIIHAIPSSYTIDSKANIMNPLGLYSHRLEVDLYLISAKISSLQGLNRAINQSGYEIKDLYFCGFATSQAVFNKELGQGLNIFCDIGSDITELLIFSDGNLRDIEILKTGGEELTKQLQEAFKIPPELAEEIKISHGIVGDPSQIKEDKEILVKKTNLYKPIKQKLVSEIISASAGILCSNIKEAIEKRVSCYEANNFIVTGRSVLLEGFIELLEKSLPIPVKLGRITNPAILSAIKDNPALTGQKYLMYLTCLGILAYALEKKPAEILPVHQPAKNFIFRTINRFREVYQEYF
jgi:cell division protein FtsA